MWEFCVPTGGRRCLTRWDTTFVTWAPIFTSNPKIRDCESHIRILSAERPNLCFPLWGKIVAGLVPPQTTAGFFPSHQNAFLITTSVGKHLTGNEAEAKDSPDMSILITKWGGDKNVTVLSFPGRDKAGLPNFFPNATLAQTHPRPWQSAHQKQESKSKPCVSFRYLLLWKHQRPAGLTVTRALCAVNLTISLMISTFWSRQTSTFLLVSTRLYVILSRIEGINLMQSFLQWHRSMAR